ncbi:AaceriAGR268Wp [[Ashbya] aceris (nom. inval.)]|nr:AaceriAGR268Wp [[Ashbya] aceris (nom. inval.)]
MRLDELLGHFKYDRVLNSNPQNKVISILGTIEGKDAILTLEKTHFTFQAQTLQAMEAGDKDALQDEGGLSCTQNIRGLKEVCKNDVYFWGVSELEQDVEEHPAAKVNLVWPATAVHIRKFEEQQVFMCRETPEMYRTIVKPYIDEMTQNGRLQWVHNILHNGAEAERIVYKDFVETKPEDGIVILPDMKWDGVNLDSLYLVAIAYRDDVRSLRDLRPEHQEWLKSTANKIKAVVPGCFNYSVRAEQLRLYVHYQPSYYHFHIHIVNVKHPGVGADAGKSVLLDDVIDQLNFLGPEGFANRTLTYPIGENHDLWDRGLKKAVAEQLVADGIPRPHTATTVDEGHSIQ